MNLFLELRKLGKLAEQRNPMYEKNKFAKIFLYIAIAFWAGYFVFFGTLFGIALQDEAVEPYHIINSGLLFILLIDTVMRMPFQKTPTQEMKPFLLLPISRHRLIDFLLIRSGLDKFNLFWLFFFVPFALISITRFYGLAGVCTYCLGIWLLMVFNNYWFLLCRTLTGERIWWIALPISLYGCLLAAMIVPDDSPVFDWFLNLGEGFITGNLFSFIGMSIAIALMGWVNRYVIRKLVYNELNKVEDTTVRVKHVSEYRFLDRYGELGEYIRLELKLLLRNKICKHQLNMVLVVTTLFSCLISFTDVYTGLMKDFWILYNYQLMGLMFLSSLMSYEGNYIDGLMSRKESIYTLLRAKYIVYSLALIIPFILMTPGMISGNLSAMLCFCWLFFVPGPIYFLLFQLAVYNNKTINLNTKMMSRQNVGSGIQSLVSGASFFVPFALYGLITLLTGEAAAPWVVLGIGLTFILASPYWLKHIYRRFMKRRYQNLEGFRNSREK